MARLLCFLRVSGACDPVAEDKYRRKAVHGLGCSHSPEHQPLAGCSQRGAGSWLGLVDALTKKACQMGVCRPQTAGHNPAGGPERPFSFTG